MIAITPQVKKNHSAMQEICPGSTDGVKATRWFTVAEKLYDATRHSIYKYYYAQ